MNTEEFIRKVMSIDSEIYKLDVPDNVSVKIALTTARNGLWQAVKIVMESYGNGSKTEEVISDDKLYQ